RVSTVSRRHEHGSTKSDQRAKEPQPACLYRRTPMAPTPTTYRLLVGSDVSATTGTAAWMHTTDQPSRAITFDQTPTGFAELQRRFLARQAEPHAILIVMEARGTSWMRLATTLLAAGFALAVIKAAQAHDFAK